MFKEKSFDQMIKDAKERFKNDEGLLNVIKEMEKEISIDSRVKGTLITMFHCEER